MRVNQIVCPKCKASLTSKAGIEEGTAIACPKCKNKFAVAAPKEEEVIEDFDVVDEDEEETPKKKPPVSAPKKPAKKSNAEEFDDEEEEAPKKKPTPPAPKTPAKKPAAEADFDFFNDAEDTPKKKPAPARKTRDEDEDDEPVSKSKRKNRDDDEDEDDKPRSKRKSRNDDDEEDDRPKSKRKSRDDDDEDDDRPRKKRRRGNDEDDDKPKSGYAKLKANPWVRGIVLGVLLIIMCVLGYMLYLKNKKEGSSDSSSIQKEDDRSKPIVGGTNPGGNSVANQKEPILNDRRLVGRWTADTPKGEKYDLTYRNDGSYEMSFSKPKVIGQGSSNGRWRIVRQGASSDEIFVEMGGTTVRVHFDGPDQIEHDLWNYSGGGTERIAFKKS